MKSQGPLLIMQREQQNEQSRFGVLKYFVRQGYVIFCPLYFCTIKRQNFCLRMFEFEPFLLLISMLFTPYYLKVAFFGKCDEIFSAIKISKKVFQKTILSLKSKFPANNSKGLLSGNLNFKFRVVFWNIFS